MAGISTLPAHAAGNSLCGGFAPLTSGCRASATAPGRNLDAMFASETFTGTATYTVTGPAGSIRASCFAYPSVSQCTPTYQGSFAAGDSLAIAVDVTGAGEWRFALTV